MASRFLNTTAVAILAKFTLLNVSQRGAGNSLYRTKGGGDRSFSKRVVCSLPSLGLDKSVLWIKPVSDG